MSSINQDCNKIPQSNLQCSHDVCHHKRMMYTEKQTEDWLKQETRTLTMPDGSMQPLTVFTLVWEKADSLILLSNRSIDELVGFAVEEAALQSMPFKDAFVGVVAWMYDQRRAYIGL